MSITLPDNWTVISLIISVIGLIFTIAELVRTKSYNRKLKKANEKEWAARCNQVTEITDELAENMVAACQIVQTTCVNQNKPCNILMSKVDSSVRSTRRLLHFCEEMYDEHYKNYGRHLDQNLIMKLQKKACLLPPEK